MQTPAILWHRLDTPGHDACRLVRQDDVWRLEGVAVYLHSGLPAQLAYALECDVHWQTRRAMVRGWIGPRALDIRIERGPDGRWFLGGDEVGGLDGCPDLDLGFTPATNLSQLRRLGLEVGQGADAPVAWLDMPDAALMRLEQRYERQTELDYWYQSPAFGYAALLRVGASGFIERYPDLWEAEGASTPDRPEP